MVMPRIVIINHGILFTLVTTVSGRLIGVPAPAACHLFRIRTRLPAPGLGAQMSQRIRTGPIPGGPPRA